MTEYPAMIYRSNRNNVYIANCLAKNLVGFGKTEEDALNNLKSSIQNVCDICDISVTPIHGISIA